MMAAGSNAHNLFEAKQCHILMTHVCCLLLNGHCSLDNAAVWR